MKFEEQESETSNKESSDVLEQFSNESGFVEIDGKSEQIGIGKVEEMEEFISVDVLGGCSKVALIDTMRKIVRETKKEVRAVFQDKELILKPESIDEEK